MEITLKTNEAVSIASLSEFAQKGRDAHPELARVYLSIADGKLKALATDRYTMASYSIELEQDITAELVLSVNACKWLMTNVKKTTIGYVVLTKTEDSLVITTANGSFNDELIESEKGKTLGDFIEEKTKENATQAYPVKLTVAHLLKLGKLSSNFGKVDQVVQTLTPQERENRSGPVKLQADNFSVIIQPRNN
jgi:DNA polymerase III sliding clamp (beta) subunit (PCNA family)